MGQSLSLVKFEKECQSALRKVDVRVKVDRNACQNVAAMAIVMDIAEKGTSSEGTRLLYSQIEGDVEGRF